MILVNGYIKPKVKTGGGLDGNGNPVKGAAVWGPNIPCRHKTNRSSFKGKSNGNTFIVATFEILIESQPFPYEQIQLFGEGGALIGAYSIMWKEDLDAVGNLKITV